MTATLNTVIEYRDGYITVIDSLPEPITVDDAELVESDCKGWGDSNAVVKIEGGYYLATIDDQD